MDAEGYDARILAQAIYIYIYIFYVLIYIHSMYIKYNVYKGASNK